MKSANRAKMVLLFFGDVIALYAALFAMLVLRYGADFYAQFVHAHAGPFTIIFVAWVVVFYIAGLYDLHRLRNNLDFFKTLALSLAINAAIAVFFFYLIPAFGIAPKRNLLAFIVIFAVIEIVWRRFFNRATASGEAPNKILLIGSGAAIDEVAAAVAANSQLGYAVQARLTEEAAERAPRALEETAAARGANLVVMPRDLKRRDALAPAFYALFASGIRVIDLDYCYELIMRKVPLDEIKETWFLENIEGAARFYDPLKRAWEFLAALALGIVLLPIEVLIALLVVFTSRGPAIYQQTRTGERGREFTLYKFRSMKALSADGSAETAGAQWAAHGDARTTVIGKFLRASHLDELPQLWNIVRGDLSFVGPRPERPEFVAKLTREIPYYEVRLLILPGVTGWAQINHRADLTLNDVRQKLQYDIYYLKNRSFILDAAIVLKTIKSIFVNPKE